MFNISIFNIIKAGYLELTFQKDRTINIRMVLAEISNSLSRIMAPLIHLAKHRENRDNLQKVNTEKKKEKEIYKKRNIREAIMK